MILVYIKNYFFVKEFIVFSKGFDRVYVYLHNLGEEKVYVSRVFLDGEEVTKLCSIPSREVLPGEKLCITINLGKPLTQGEYVVINITTANYTVEGPIKAEAITRVFSHFPICFENGETDPGLYMNMESYFLSYPTGESKSIEVEESGEKAYHISDCPMHAHENLIAAGRYILSRADACRAFDARHPVHAGICRINMLRGYALFGETADVTLINPNVKLDYSTETLARLAKKTFEPRPLQTMVILSKNPPYFEYRYPTPEEVRLMVYYSVSAGSKGIFYRGRPPTEELKNVVRTLNGELQILKRFLKIGEPVSMAEQALAKAEELLSLAPYLFERARALKALNRMEVAISKFQKASEMLKSQDKTMELFRYAVRLEGREDREICRRFESVIKEIPDKKTTIFLQDALVECYENLAEYTLAREAFAKYISLVEKTEGVEEADLKVMRKADEWFQDGEYAEGARWYAVLVDRLTDRGAQPVCVPRTGRDEQILRALVKLRECYEKVSGYCDDKPLLTAGHIKFISYDCPWNEQVEESYDYLRNLYANNQDFQSVIRVNQVYLTRYPDAAASAELQYQIGILYFVQNQVEEALSAFKKMVENYPNDELANMAKVYIQFNRRSRRSSFSRPKDRENNGAKSCGLCTSQNL